MGLVDLLVHLTEGETLAKIAHRAGVSLELLDQMMLDLVRGGYLERWETGCASGSCSGCALASSCKGVSGWRLTERGKTMVQRANS